jgi:hypothetical protein
MGTLNDNRESRGIGEAIEGYSFNIERMKFLKQLTIN